MQHDHPPDYKHWDLLDHFTVAQVACLWCEIKPGGSHLFMRLQHPEIIAIEQFIENAIRGGKLTAGTKHAFVSIGDYSKAIVRRSELKALAEEKGKRPPFLFPEDRHELPPKTANPAKAEYVYNKTTKRIEFRSPVDATDTLAGVAETVRPPALGQTQGQPLDNERGQSVGTATDYQPLSQRDQRKQETQARHGRWRDRYRELKAANKSLKRIEIARIISREERKAGNLKATPETIKRQLDRLDEDDRVGRLRTGQKKIGQ